MKPRFAAPLAVGALAIAHAAGASPAFVELLDSALTLGRPPPCSVCHEGGDADGGAARTAFAQALLEHGFEAGDPASMRAALDGMKHVDSDGDGASDIDELYWGGDPNQADTRRAGPSESPPIYGCAVANTAETGQPALVVAASLALVAVRSARARRGSRRAHAPAGRRNGNVT